MDTAQQLGPRAYWGTAVRPASVDEVGLVRRPDAAAFLLLLKKAFAYMDGRIDPPSSLHRMTPQDVINFAEKEALLAVYGTHGRPVACLFATLRPDHVYLGKWAVDPAHQGQGYGQSLLKKVEQLARDRGAAYLLLETRIGLADNHAAFAHLGFREVGRTSHPGFDRPTSVTMRRDLAV